MHYGWVIVAACMVIGISGYGTYFSFTLFYPLLVDEFGWSRAGISGALSVGLVAYGVCALPMGWCVDRYGPRVTIVAGGLLFGAGTALGGAVSELWHLYALYGGITAIGMGAAWAPLVSTTSRWFEARRGLAVGLASIGGGTGTFFIAPLADRLLVAVGWREAYGWLGLLSGSLIVGAALLLHRDPAAKGATPYGGGPRDPAARVPASAPDFAGVGAIARTAVFWRAVLTFGMWWFAGAIVYVQLAPFMLEKGLDLRFAATAAVAFGAGNAAGKIAMGLLGDRAGGRRAYQLSTLLAALSMLGLAYARGPHALLALTAAFGFGFGGGAPHITTVNVSLFGLRSVGALMGAVLALIGVLGAGGPLVSGAIYDLVGSYRPAYLLGVAVFAVSAALCETLRTRGSVVLGDAK